ncbi:MAG: hypothetical protein ACK4YL_03290 [Microcystis sp.]|jgi:hypothetical protein|nr:MULTISPECIES: hypothetical protein [Microcystis]MCA2795167.1 hypothetical protein [Microcystis sp. M100S2]MCA2817401.1 hypothetical protein [Microcystis sp. M085S1]MCA2879077.1 hypothetical protein [Microcystis sp. M046S1]MCA2884337.1 hypothetical protein [Microcystis sp. M043S1]MCZ8058412.1 hypothetical protein [Microcystis sp. LE19-12.2C]
MDKYLDVIFPERLTEKNAVWGYFSGHQAIVEAILAIFFDPLAITDF